MSLYKRTVKIIAIALVLLIAFSFIGCSKEQDSGGFSVCYINTYNGGSTLVKTDDGKTVLIDTGADNDDVYKVIKEKLGDTKVIDYLILTCTEESYIGNARKLATDYEIGKTYLPYITDTERFRTFDESYKALKDKSEIKYYNSTTVIKSGETNLVFLSPLPVQIGDEYDRVNLIEIPSGEDLKNISPIIYLSYKDVRFLFLSVSGKDAQEKVLDRVKAKVYDNLYPDTKIDLLDIDYLELSSSGDAKSFNYSLVQYLHPKNAVISVNAKSSIDLPSKSVLYDLTEISPDINIFRTDVLGTVKISVNERCEKTLKTDVIK